MDRIDNRRLTEDNLYEEIEDGVVIRRNPLKRQKKVKLSTATYTFLQFHRIIFQWALRNHNLKSTELDALLYIFPLVTFTHKDFMNCLGEIGSYNPNTFTDLRKKGFISNWSSSGGTNYFILTTKASNLINRMHKMFMLEEEIPMSPRRNVIAKEGNKRDEQLMKLFQKFNSKIK